MFPQIKRQLRKIAACHPKNCQRRLARWRRFDQFREVLTWGRFDKSWPNISRDETCFRFGLLFTSLSASIVKSADEP